MSKPETAPAETAGTSPATAPAADPVKTSTLSAVLGLVKPETTDVKPPQPQRPLSLPVDQDPDDDTIKPQPVVEKFLPKKEEPAKADAPAKDAPAKEAAPATAPKEAAPKEAAPKVQVRKRADTTKVIDEVKRIVEDKLKNIAAPAQQAPAKVETPSEPEPVLDLTPEEREEYDLAVYAEKKDPSKKGLSKQFVDFYAKQKKYLEDAAAKATEEGEQYDPTADAEFKKWLSKNEPKLTRAERKKFESDRIYDKAKEDAAREAEERLKPKLTELERRTAELIHRPEINNRVTKFLNETLDGMPAEVVKFYRENGADVEKTRAEFPLEFEAVSRNLAGARALAEEFLAVKRGLKPFNPYDPSSNPKGDQGHRFLNDFIDEQGRDFETNGGNLRVRDGKTFVSPRRWNPNESDKHWTFDEEDVLLMLKTRALSDTKSTIEVENQRLAKMGFQRVKKVETPPSASEPSTAAKEPAASPRTPATPLPGAATSAAAADPSSILSQVLNLNKRT